ncbi:MAG TPA: DUF3987 domain-containing protein [Phycisphaerae bacterium]|nr:DUF3987 domain-containing protein [Phycisphaerae bacterium]
MVPFNETLAAALAYAERGWPAVPLHTVKGGRCSCGKPDCVSPGKHPRTAHGLKDASGKPEVITGWWKQWPDANVGIVTGAAAGIVVIDIDPRHGGHDSWAALVEQYGDAPTLEALTGGGGRHLIFSHPGGTIRNRANVRPGIDVRGDGGYIVAAPSLHASGKRYVWPEDWREWDPAPLPGWLHELLLARPEPGHAGGPTTGRNGDDLARLLWNAGQYVARAAGAAEGSRNNAAFNLAGHLAAFTTDTGLRLTETQIVDLLRPWNYRNAPPLSEHELRAVVASALINGQPRPEHKVHTGNPGAQPGGKAEAARPAAPAEPFIPFPVNALPEPVRSFVSKAAVAIGCDASFIALPLLAGLASAIGTTRRIALKRGWTEPAIVWAVVVGDSGTLKSPAIELALRPIRKRQRDAMRRHGVAMETYVIELAQYERELADWKRSKAQGEPPKKPKEPVPDRCYCDDVTIEALAALLVNQPRGLLLVRDELAGWLGSFDRYAQGKGGDAPKWLEVFGGRPVVVDRKSGIPRTIYIPQAAVSITGGIQPETLRRALGTAHRENGLAARLLLSCPPRRQKRWTEADMDAATEAKIERVFERLYELQPDADDEGEPRPRLVKLTAEGKAAWVRFYNAHAAEHAELAGDLSAVWSKLEGYAARLALVVHFIRWAADDPTLQSPDAVDETSIAAGVELSRWFGHEARRVYAILGESDDDRDRRRLAELVARKGGTMTPRELQQTSRRYPTAADAEAALQELVAAELGTWEAIEPTAKGGRPARRFRLKNAPPVYETAPPVYETPQNPKENRGSVDVDSVDTPENEPEAPAGDDDDWGVL